MTLEDAKLFLRVDTDYEDALIQSLINVAADYVEVATGLTPAQQTGDPTCETLQKFLIASLFYNRDGGGNVGANSTILSLLKTIKAKAANQ